MPLDQTETSFWDRVHTTEATFRAGLEDDVPKEATNALLELDRTIWNALQDLESDEFISQARDILRELIVSLGVKLEASPGSRADCLVHLVGELLALRETFRKNNQWKEADSVRKCLLQSDIIVEDTPQGPRWRLK
jgi:cysteinyl-tRNA synthetase